MRLFLVTILFLISSRTIVQACTGPDGVIGDIIYAENTQQYIGCTPLGWTAFHSGTTTEVSSDGLVGHWKLDEAGGTLADSSVQDNDGTSVGGLTYGATGVLGSAADFDGNNDGIIVSNSVSLQPNDEITLSAWVYARSLTANGRKIICKGDCASGSWRSYRLDIYNDRVRFGLTWAEDGSVAFLDYLTSFPLHEWHLITGNYDGETMRLYIDGEEVETLPATKSIQASGFNVHIGTPNGGTEATRVWDGFLDDVRIFDKALDVAEIAELYNGSTGIFCTNPNGALGDIAYATNAGQFVGCTPDGWRSFHSAASGGGTSCTGPDGELGDLTYAINTDQFVGCTPDGWRSFHQKLPCEAVGPGTTCANGTIYAGLSPDGDVPMFTTPADAGLFIWGPFGDTVMQNCITTTPGAQASCQTGEANTNLLVALSSSYAAAYYCDDLSAHGKDDWYLPSQDELQILYDGRAAIGGFPAGSYQPEENYWSSSEFDSVGAMNIYFGNDTGQLAFARNESYSVRCVRKN